MLATRRTGSPTQRAPLESYFREIDATSLLTAAREKELSVALADGMLQCLRVVRLAVALGAEVEDGSHGGCLRERFSRY